jgi:acyl carrier protein
LWNPEEDSLEFVELTMRLEEEFALELSDADAERFASMTLAELAAEIDRLRRLGVERGSDTEGEAA